MRDRMSFAEVCIRQQLRFNVAEASAKSSRVLIAMISAEQQRSPQANPPRQTPPPPQLQQQQQAEQQRLQVLKEMHHDERSGQVYLLSICIYVYTYIIVSPGRHAARRAKWPGLSLYIYLPLLKEMHRDE